MDNLTSYGVDLAYELSYPIPYTNLSVLVPLIMSVLGDPTVPPTKKAFQDEYDYIIVGGGTAGSVVASRLTEDQCATVLVLEAGPKIPLLSEVPGTTGVYYGTNIDWKYYTTPQKHTGFGLVDNKIPFPAGKTLGGSSTINGMQYVRGNRHNFDDWERMGATGWSYKDVLPYFKKAEDNKNRQYVLSGFHGESGPVTVSKHPYVPDTEDAVFAGAMHFGYRIGDSNGAIQTGFYDAQATMRNGQRCSSAKAYLVPAGNRTNLDIVINAQVNKVLIKGDKPTATGVMVDFEGETHTVRARKEVLLAAGAVNSAQLLMLSGIGPREDLLKLDIPVVMDLPVGKNFMDHCSSFLNYIIGPNISTLTEKLMEPDNIQEYMDNKTGPLAVAASVTALAFLKNEEIQPKEDKPNYQLYLNENDAGLFQVIFGFTEEVFDKYFKPHVGQPLLTCVTQVVQPKSRGTIRLNSSDPYDPPIIDPNFLAEKQDEDDLVEGLKMCQKMSKTEAWQSINAKLFDEPFPGCEGDFGNEDAYLRCVTKYIIITQSHQAGTAKMGDPTDPEAVVDPRLKVKGVGNLRVVDASIMPVIASGNTMAAVYMIAEKAADLIKEDHPECLI